MIIDKKIFSLWQWIRMVIWCYFDLRSLVYNICCNARIHARFVHLINNKLLRWGEIARKERKKEFNIKHSIREIVTFTIDPFFFKANPVSSLVGCTWTLKEIVVGKNLCSWQKLSPNTNSSQPSLYPRKQHMWHFYMPCDVLTNNML